MAVLAGLTPPEFEVRFYDDRLEEIPFDRADRPGGDQRGDVHGLAGLQDCAAVSPPRRSGRPRRVPCDLDPQEAALEADAIVVGNAEPVWRQLLDDARHGRTGTALRRHNS